MTHPTNRSVRIDLASRASPRRLLARILDDASLVATVQNLAPRALGKLIAHIGLEDSGEILALATTEQIRGVFDDDLWKSERPGRDEVFDADRFALWLEVMLEAGEDFVAEKLMELPEDMVTLALHRHLLVLDMDQPLATEASDGDDVDLIDKALASCLCEEMDQYHLVSRRHDGWDAIVTTLAALDKHDHALLARVLERCAYLSSQYIEDNGGLYEVLTSDEMLESDLAADREDRRAGEGFLAPSQATSFLALCRTTLPADVLAKPRDAVTSAYFRDLAPATTTAKKSATRARALGPGGAAPDRTADLEQMLAELEDDDDPREARPVFLLGAPTTAPADAGAIFKMALATLHERDPNLHAQRMEELAYLTNVLVSGCAPDGRAFRPFEAVVAVAAVCNLGLERLAQGAHDAATRDERATGLLAREGADKVFRVGWWTLHREVSLAAREALGRKRLTDLDVDEPARDALGGLLSECPLLAGALGGGGAAAYPLDRDRRFVATEADLERARAFLSALRRTNP